MQIKKWQLLRNGSLSAFFYFRLTVKTMIFCISKAIEQNGKDLLLISCNFISPEEMERT